MLTKFFLSAYAIVSLLRQHGISKNSNPGLKSQVSSDLTSGTSNWGFQLRLSRLMLKTDLDPTSRKAGSGTYKYPYLTQKKYSRQLSFLFD